ncbi:MAG: DUF1460 domain-containing protein [Dissulfurispiraceae bacterium]|nr:DUF1460 domain-containing protein [Dissulfurispiraceae bacterium]
MNRVKKQKPVIIPGIISIDLVEKTIQHGASAKNIPERISIISSIFLGIPYKTSTIDEHSKDAEQLVIDFSGVDCFTFLDYVESMRRATTWRGFIKTLRSTRYRKSSISFKHRNHFFSDWIKNNTSTIADFTKKTASHKTVIATKKLNRKDDGSLYVRDIKPVQRRINYIPSSSLDQNIIDRLRTGDYAGIYSDKPGLDVSHVGIIIKTESGVKLRHASSARTNRCVVDEDLFKYISKKPGLVLFRPI